MATIQQPKITAYLKTHCGWSRGVRAVLEKYNLAYEDKDIIQSEADYMEMLKKSKQHLSPCVEINGVMLADVSGEEGENYLISKGLINKSNAATNVPINAACQDH